MRAGEADLIYPGYRSDVATYLDTYDWQTVGASVAELFVANGLSPLGDHQNEATFTALVYVTATRK